MPRNIANTRSRLPAVHRQQRDNAALPNLAATMSLYPIPFGIALLLAVHGLRKGSLSESGAIAAFLVGYGHLANPCKAFGVALIAFYFLGSRATKVRYRVSPVTPSL